MRLCRLSDLAKISGNQETMLQVFGSSGFKKAYHLEIDWRPETLSDLGWFKSGL